jgi:hypothetical protein
MLAFAAGFLFAVLVAAVVVAVDAFGQDSPAPPSSLDAAWLGQILAAAVLSLLGGAGLGGAAVHRRYQDPARGRPEPSLERLDERSKVDTRELRVIRRRLHSLVSIGMWAQGAAHMVAEKLGIHLPPLIIPADPEDSDSDDSVPDPEPKAPKP